MAVSKEDDKRRKENARATHRTQDIRCCANCRFLFWDYDDIRECPFNRNKPFHYTSVCDEHKYDSEEI